MSRPPHFFDIHSAEALFALLKSVKESFASSRAKRTQDLLLLVFGLTHLREWIAPDYDPLRPATTPPQQFFQKIYALNEFKMIQGLCNRSKHMVPSSNVMGTLYESRIDDWPDLDSVGNFDRGFPTAYSVDDRDILDVVEVVIAFYEKHWFRTEGACVSLKRKNLSKEDNGPT